VPSGIAAGNMTTSCVSLALMTVIGIDSQYTAGAVDPKFCPFSVSVSADRFTAALSTTSCLSGPARTIRPPPRVSISRNAATSFHLDVRMASTSALDQATGGPCGLFLIAGRASAAS
jgi:hypothetical protein